MRSHLPLILAAILMAVGCNSNDSKPLSDGPKMPSQSPFDITRCYPYIVPKAYLSNQPDDGKGLVRPLGHDLFVLLVHDHDGLVENVTPNDLTKLKLTPDAAHERALENLEKLFAAGQIKAMKYDKGPDNRPFIVVGEHWAAAACILLPNVRRFAQKNLGVDEILASIPHRDVMLLFQKPSKSDTAEMRNFVLEHEGESLKPLTFELFELTGSGPAPMAKGP